MRVISPCDTVLVNTLSQLGVLFYMLGPRQFSICAYPASFFYARAGFPRGQQCEEPYGRRECQPLRPRLHPCPNRSDQALTEWRYGQCSALQQNGGALRHSGMCRKKKNSPETRPAHVAVQLHTLENLKGRALCRVSAPA
ncbi:conserved hypothetical protein, unlikely [Trypanosoma brucei gambiense DAL972]|uniref:Uncharacterized protein n=1 Tax=Trypanosoma brucei gambiense (strain MHOM/CI/86/DAL972) TaxID=679716 RepID=D0A474_TRYB9|nr:conserved hypothetical protein, unlikely [Trypanosoma brucei gambiense DAL972]CBH16068.1 conserved hypothetical protein, unlikely [Trypanosoma brucei gambiense DAL972]|eukprot:XP_011778332.1 conserved hypothetical protein, unlikely [Trypanosoma brucei gambiense DAL972]